MKKLNKKIALIALITSSYLFGIEIELNKDYYELPVAAEKMVVIDFPFKISDHQFLGDQGTIEGDMKEKSLYLRITSGSADVTVWGGEKPILISIIAKKEGDRRISFYENPNNTKNLKKEYKEWNHDIKVAEQIEMYSKKNAIAGYEVEKLDIPFSIGNELSVMKIERLTNASNYAFEKLLVINDTDKVIDLFSKKEFYFTKRNDYVIDAVSFNDRYLLPNQQTYCYLGLEKR
ncbi:hypothetical protein ACOTWR_06190 [Aliarcobacter butzleri]|uniref:hypothetical protein n=1 Tax=Aliarcobacter butzleri TaxID=28197 RepID=UPI0021B2E01F|nr:hypothetical protein [Aliarcobacter butzleri]MCT7563166.1 hypothetical protein [Aliarcobacter butzleri]MCT7578641.1 hypothetical protein [Aliarcobacter butzleri]MCT7647582.1 hypothetical protein [Aliarcobacter butzleri]